MKNKKKKFILILFIILILSLGITYAFFTYNRIGDEDNTLVAGDIYMNLSDNINEISLTNQFPMTPEEARARSDNYIDFTVSGKNTSNDSIFYEIGLIYGDDIAGKDRLHDYDLAFDLIDLDNNNYLVNEGNFKDLSRSSLYVDTIGTVNSYSRNFRLRMWINDSTIISDTEPEAHYRASSSGNPDLLLFSNTYANVRVKVYGDMKEKMTTSVLYDILSNNAVADNIRSTYVSSNSGIDFSNSSSNTNGKGLYTLSSTIGNDYPVRYYRGNVNNNNVIFGNKCWQIVRTTETGGVKMIYNGVPKYSYAKEEAVSSSQVTATGINYNNSKGGWYLSTGSTALFDINTSDYTMMFSFAEAGSYYIEVTSNGSIGAAAADVSLTDISGANFIMNYGSENYFTSFGFNYDGVNDLMFIFLAFEANSDILIKIYKGYLENDKLKCSFDPITGNAIMPEPSDINSGMGLHINQFDLDSIFNDVPRGGFMNDQSYMGSGEEEEGLLYEFPAASNTFGRNILYDGSHRTYSFGLSTSATPSIDNRYVFGLDENGINRPFVIFTYYGNNVYALKFKDGETTLEDILDRLFKNKVSSYLKTETDLWFENNLLSYTDFLEDTVWCNDRSVVYVTKPNNKFTAETITQMNLKDGVINLSCPSIRDSFTVSKKNGNGDLTYPIAYLTAPETVLSGLSENSIFGTSDSSFLSIFSPSMTVAYEENGNGSYNLIGNTYLNDSGVFKPSISLKPGTSIISGDGSFNDPYVVRGN